MSQNHLNDFLDPLNTVKKVEAPPFLLSKIERKIIFVRENSISPRLGWIMINSVGMLVLFNLFILSQSSWIPTEKNSLLQSLQIQHTNSLYP